MGSFQQLNFDQLCELIGDATLELATRFHEKTTIVLPVAESPYAVIRMELRDQGLALSLASGLEPGSVTVVRPEVTP